MLASKRGFLPSLLNKMPLRNLSRFAAAAAVLVVVGGCTQRNIRTGDGAQIPYYANNVSTSSDISGTKYIPVDPEGKCYIPMWSDEQDPIFIMVTARNQAGQTVKLALPLTSDQGLGAYLESNNPQTGDASFGDFGNADAVPLPESICVGRRPNAYVKINNGAGVFGATYTEFSEDEIPFKDLAVTVGDENMKVESIDSAWTRRAVYLFNQRNQVDGYYFTTQDDRVFGIINVAGSTNNVDEQIAAMNLEPIRGTGRIIRAVMLNRETGESEEIKISSGLLPRDALKNPPGRLVGFMGRGGHRGDKVEDYKFIDAPVRFIRQEDLDRAKSGKSFTGWSQVAPKPAAAPATVERSTAAHTFSGWTGAAAAPEPSRPAAQPGRAPQEPEITSTAQGYFEIHTFPVERGAGAGNPMAGPGIEFLVDRFRIRGFPNGVTPDMNAMSLGSVLKVHKDGRIEDLRKGQPMRVSFSNGAPSRSQDVLEDRTGRDIAWEEHDAGTFDFTDPSDDQEFAKDDLIVPLSPFCVFTASGHRASASRVDEVQVFIPTGNNLVGFDQEGKLVTRLPDSVYQELDRRDRVARERGRGFERGF